MSKAENPPPERKQSAPPPDRKQPSPLAERKQPAPLPPLPPTHVVAIVTDPIDVPGLIASVAGEDAGAIAVFLGTVRATTGERRVLFLDYEAYAPMAEKVMLEIARTLTEEMGPCRIAILHRVGRLKIGETSVAIAVASPHRRVALAACAEAIERVKKTVPIWKKEHFEGGAVWIEGDPGKQSRAGPIPVEGKPTKPRRHDLPAREAAPPSTEEDSK